jgi:hypothetical protein
MFAGEVYVSDSRELLALEVHPARTYTHQEAWLRCAQAWQAEMIRAVFDSDPF